MGVVVRSNDSDAFQLDVAGEWNIKQQLLVAIGFNEEAEVKPILVAFEDVLACLDEKGSTS